MHEKKFLEDIILGLEDLANFWLTSGLLFFLPLSTGRLPRLAKSHQKSPTDFERSVEDFQLRFWKLVERF